MTLAWVSSVWLVVHALAAFRLTRLWLLDSLPPLPAIRHHVLQKWGNKWWTDLFVCGWCAGFWISAAVVAFASSPLAPAWNWLSLALAVSAVVGLMMDRKEEG